MKIQIILTALIAAILMFAISPMVMAEDNTSEVTNDSVAPILISTNPNDGFNDLNDNESASPFNMGMRQIGIWLTFNQERKAQLELELAKLRLIQAKIAAKNNNTMAMQKALDAHEAILKRVDARIAKIESRNISVEKLRGLERAVQVHEDRMAFLNEILNSANLTEEQRANIEDRLAHIENVTDQLKNLSEKRQEIRDQRQADRDARFANRTPGDQPRGPVMSPRQPPVEQPVDNSTD